MRPSVVEAIAEGLAWQEANGREPPFFCCLLPKRAARLRRELADMGVPFGLPLDGYVPDPREDEREWTYLGVILQNVHVFAACS